MSPDGDFRRIAIVGVGLIGGSLAFALRRRFPEVTIVGVDRDDVVTAARQLGAVNQGATDLAAVAGADLVVLAAPVVANLDVMARLPEILDGPAIVTDVGSTKRATLEAARSLPARLEFIGGHPLAGAARGGIEASRPDLFERRTWVLTPSLSTPRAIVQRISSFVRALGAVPLELDADTHDRVLAFTSHLPQLTASALMQVVGDGVGDHGLQFSGAGLADTTRVSASPARIWTDICRTNADELIPALDRLIESLQSARRDLAGGRTLEPMFDSAQRWRAKLRS